MSIEVWLAFVAASAALLVIPGPTVLMILSYALSQGRRVALATVVGVALGDFLAMTASLLGLGALVLASATLFQVLKWIGAAYLVWLGIQLLRARPAQGRHVESGLAVIVPRKVLRHSATVAALNPKSIAFFLAFVPQFIQPAAPMVPQLIILIATFVGLGALVALSYALAAGQMRARISKASTLRMLNRTGGATLIGMGILTATLRRTT